MNAVTKPSLINALAARYDMEPSTFYSTIQKTVMPGNATVEQTAAFLMVAKRYDLDPILKQIYAFPSKGGGITPIISIDGWCELINRQPAMDGMVFEDHFDADGRVYAITCKIHRKDRSHPVVVTEYLDECQRATDPWRQSPKRMLRHRAMIQCARYAFGLSGAFDEGHQLEVEVNGETVPVNLERIHQQVAPPSPKTPPSPRKKAQVKEEERHDPETGEVFDPEVFLGELDARLNEAGNREEIVTIWDDFDPRGNLKGFPDHMTRAQDTMAFHQNRIASVK
jgi:phage recombination protein Bet